jgi:hypothetical protein
MKKLLTLFIAVILFAQFSSAQKPKTGTPAPAPKPKGPSPYVLKKELEPQMADLNAKVNAASNAAGVARRSVEAGFSRLTLLDSQMSDVQSILNSANFQIAMNADSLKETRSTIEDLNKKTDEHFTSLKSAADGFAQTVWIVTGLLFALSIAVFVILMSMINKKMAQLKVILHMNEEVLKKSMLTSQEKVQKELKSELQAFESRSLTELTSLKKDLSQQIMVEKNATAAAIQTIHAKIESLEPKKEDGTDPEVFI